MANPNLGDVWKCCHPDCLVQILVTNDRVRSGNYANGPFYCTCGSVMKVIRERPETDPANPGYKKKKLY